MSMFTVPAEKLAEDLVLASGRSGTALDYQLALLAVSISERIEAICSEENAAIERLAPDEREAIADTATERLIEQILDYIALLVPLTSAPILLSKGNTVPSAAFHGFAAKLLPRILLAIDGACTAQTGQHLDTLRVLNRVRTSILS